MRIDCTVKQLNETLDRIKAIGVTWNITKGIGPVKISLFGPVANISLGDFGGLEGIENVVRVSKPYKLASLEGRNNASKVLIGETILKPGRFMVMAGPCSVESEEQTLRIAQHVAQAGATVLRGGAFKPRSSPYSFQGLGEKGLKILAKARQKTGLLIVTECMDIQNLSMVAEYTDVVQIGARNMQNYSLLKALGKIKKPVMLKRGMSATVDEWLLSAEYIMSSGNDQIILCERGIRSFDQKYTRNVLDLNVVPVLKQLTHLPVVIDPSHGTGYKHLVSPMALAAMAVGANGVIVEVHDRPKEALSDGVQALLPYDFYQLMEKFKKISSSLDIELETIFKKHEKKVA